MFSNKYGDGLMFYISGGIPCEVLTNHTALFNVEMIAIDLTK